MSSLRTSGIRLISQRITTSASSSTTCSIIALPLRCQHTRQSSTVITPWSSKHLPRVDPPRWFTTSRSPRQRQSDPSQVGTNPNQTPPPGSTPQPELDSGIPPSKIYKFEDIQQLSSHPSPNRILIDVREPSEILGTGRIPGAKNIPISSAADSFFLAPEEFEDRFGFDRPTADQEVIFYCKAGVRSKAAARLAGQAGFGGKIGEFPGSWVEWFDRGGEVERVE